MVLLEEKNNPSKDGEVSAVRQLTSKSSILDLLKRALDWEVDERNSVNQIRKLE